ncbi:hypothetical protein PsYK624_032830 [Phanerochaete sordida]|uniref:F-box domain-containing protein n=1 Tax=Phanerochaete sordida TaxID=48140 RepID=A0A9P3G3H8_9APHY|nr:hypothetical protein PsYK624_032830 [Phanerochaete sordida]
MNSNVHDNTMASLLSLGDDILLEILSLLSSDELVTVRQTCKYLSLLSRERYLWNYLLRRDVTERRIPLPYYRKPSSELSSAQLETLTRHALQSASPSRSPLVTRFDQGRSVTWLRLVHGQYVLAAHNKSGESTIALYSVLSIQNGNGKPEPIATATLPGVVSSGELDVQEDQVVLSLCFQSPVRMISVMSLRRRGSELAFVELARFDSVSHIRCLRGALIGCGVRGDANLPCLLNWTTGALCTLPPSPVADGRVTAMALRDDLCVVARANVLSIYAVGHGEPVLVQDLPFDHALGTVAFAASAPASGSARLQLLITSHGGLHVYSVRQDAAGRFVSRLVAEEALKQSALLAGAPQLPRFGGSAAHVAWAKTPASFFDRQSHLCVARVVPADAPPPAGVDAAADRAAKGDAPALESRLELLAECRDFRLPSMHAMPVMDFDDGVGLLAVGNALGEVALCSYGARVSARFVDCLRPLPVPMA